MKLISLSLVSLIALAGCMKKKSSAKSSAQTNTSEATEELDAHGDRPIVTCRIENDPNIRHRNFPFGRHAIAGEYVLVEDGAPSEMEQAPSKLQIKRWRYVRKDGRIVREGLSGAPMSRIGYSKLHKVVTFSYMRYDHADHPSFQISTDGIDSIITYSQEGMGPDRDYVSFNIDCKIHKELRIHAPEFDISSLEGEDEIKAIVSMKYERYRHIYFNNINENLREKLHQLARPIAENHNYENDIPGQYETADWENEEKCGGFRSAFYWNYLTEVFDYQGDRIGYVAGRLECKNAVKLSYYRYDEISGERRTLHQRFRPSISNLVFDKDMNLLNQTSIENPIRINLERIWD